ncbi:hypothetical protein EST38_g2620 [Candolleomyces aberdarensis]|uniref:G domain-containing protein n=1 Tax=Candolleomyces aberdarensis TaxID=2316362 RepID=A0A4Q2DRZ4_9AGAR|nr:hypothetical protein EST38_g2620 [Candolleomyces aberdarensis]
MADLETDIPTPNSAIASGAQHLDVTSLGIVGVQAGRVHLNQTLAESQPVTIITTLNQTVYVNTAPAPAVSNPDNSRPVPIPKPVVDPAGTRPGDSDTQNPGRNLIRDIMIPVIGPSGGGKSTFIKNVFAALGEKENIAADDGFSSCTVDPTPYHVDIPGDVADQYELEFGDAEVINRIADWMTSK